MSQAPAFKQKQINVHVTASQLEFLSEKFYFSAVGSYFQVLSNVNLFENVPKHSMAAELTEF